MAKIKSEISLGLENIDEQKNHLLDQFILLGAVLGLSIFLVSLIPWDDSYLNIDLFIDITVQAFLFGIYFYRDRFSLKLKTNIILTLIFIAYISDLIENNISGTGISLLILIPFVAIFFYRLRTTLLIFLIGLIIYVFIAALFLNGMLDYSISEPKSILITDWINNISTIAFISVLIFIFVLRYNKSVFEVIFKLEESVTNLNEKDTQLEKTVAEKSVMIQEIHHRVKNNLAVVSGLLELQSYRVEDSEMRYLLTKTTNRIMSIAKIHEKLYESNDFKKIPLEKYISEISEIIINSINKDDKTINISLDIQIESIGVNLGVPLGIILNELITNSIKYGFINSDDHIISISIIESDDLVRVTYLDNGVGIQDFEEASIKSLGFTLIHSLMSQINAKYEYETNNKFQLSFEFPLNLDHGPYQKEHPAHS